MACDTLTPPQATACSCIDYTHSKIGLPSQKGGSGGCLQYIEFRSKGTPPPPPPSGSSPAMGTIGEASCFLHILVSEQASNF